MGGIVASVAERWASHPEELPSLTLASALCALAQRHLPTACSGRFRRAAEGDCGGGGYLPRIRGSPDGPMASHSCAQPPLGEVRIAPPMSRLLWAESGGLSVRIEIVCLSQGCVAPSGRAGLGHELLLRQPWGDGRCIRLRHLRLWYRGRTTGSPLSSSDRAAGSVSLSTGWGY